MKLAQAAKQKSKKMPTTPQPYPDKRRSSAAGLGGPVSANPPLTKAEGLLLEESSKLSAEEAAVKTLKGKMHKLQA